MMSPTRSLVLLAFLLAACGRPANTEHAAPAVPSPAQDLQSADFAAYHVEPYAGPKHAPDFSGAQRGLRVYRTALSEAVQSGPNFAGRYSLVQVGCGASCTTVYLINVSTGDIAPQLFGGELSPYALDMAHQADSGLLRAHWQIIDRQANPLRCIFENFELRSGRLASLGRVTVSGACPAPR
jgi:hypothetical protein